MTSPRSQSYLVELLGLELNYVSFESQLSLSDYVSLGKSPNLSEPQFNNL